MIKCLSNKFGYTIGQNKKKFARGNTTYFTKLQRCGVFNLMSWGLRFWVSVNLLCRFLHVVDNEMKIYMPK
jgi:hypothetical protein